MALDKRVWGKVWWKYYHIDAKCMGSVPILQNKAWENQIKTGLENLIIDFAPLPKAKKEDPADRRKLEDDCKWEVHAIVAYLVDELHK